MGLRRQAVSLGFPSAPEQAWIDGGPDDGYLSGVEGPFAGAFHSITGAAWADSLFMAGLFASCRLVLGIGMGVAAVPGIILFLMWLACPR